MMAKRMFNLIRPGGGDLLDSITYARHAISEANQRNIDNNAALNRQIA